MRDKATMLMNKREQLGEDRFRMLLGAMLHDMREQVLALVKALK